MFFVCGLLIKEKDAVIAVIGAIGVSGRTGDEVQTVTQVIPAAAR